MASNNETFADIVKRVRRDCNSYPLPTAAAEMLKLVREMDAAHKREVAELKSKMNDVVCENEAMRDACGTCGAKRECEETREKSSQVGNAAKIREAVENALDRLLLWNYTNQYTARMALGVVNKLYAAISAPPRNCDRPECATTKAAQDVWRKEDGGKTAYYEWLLATSTKGEANGIQ